MTNLNDDLSDVFGADLHQQTADEHGISREAAKSWNYATAYGAQTHRDTHPEPSSEAIEHLCANQDDEKLAAMSTRLPPVHTELCPKCRGSGRYSGYSSRGQHCFKCGGKGKLTFKSSSEQRARNRERAAQRKVEKAERDRARAADEALAWAEEHKAEHAWICAKMHSFDFARSMHEALHRWGGLTEGEDGNGGQLGAVRRLMAADAAREAQRAAEAAARMERDRAAPAVDTSGVDRLKASFDTAVRNAQARGFGLKWPRITIAEIVITMAKPDSRNPGALYVKAHGQYLGKIMDGKFHAVRECTEEQSKRVLAFLADPQAAAKQYGLETGVCCICNATLTSKWRFRGIGPICAQKFGWAGEE